MDKPPFPVLCRCCKLPAFYTFENPPKLQSDVYCFTCTNAMMQIVESLSVKNNYEWENAFKHVDELWQTEIDTQLGIATFINSSYYLKVLKINT